jgi:membrane protein DedA with SNARE-associated domain
MPEQLLTNPLLASLHLSGYLLLFLAVLIEGPVATLAGAALAASGTLHIGWTVIVVMSGNLTADIGWYLIGRAGRFATMEKKLPGLHRFDVQVRRLLITVREHPVKILVTSKLWFGVAAIPALIAAGMARIRWQKLLPVGICCEIIWSGSLFLLGYYLTNSLPSLANGLEEATIIATLLLLVATILVTIWTLLKKKLAAIR